MLRTDQVPASLWLNSKNSDESFKDKKRFYFFAVFVVFLVSCSSFLNVWVYTQWLFSYEFGFIKRGLPGELLRQFNVIPTYKFIKLFSLVISIVMVASFSLFYYRAISCYRRHTGALFIALFLLLHPATTQHFIYEIARFDNIIYILMLVCVLLLFKAPAGAGIFYISFFFIISGLVHEASVLIILPLLLGIWSFLHRSDWCVKYALYVVFVFGIAVVGTIYISAKGLDGIIDQSEYYSKLLSIDDHAYFDAVLVLYRSFGDNLSLTFNNTIDLYNVQRHLIMLAGLIPSFIVFKKFYVVTLQTVGIRSFEFVLLMLSLSPLLLYPLGYDQLRWWSMAITNLSISIVIIMIYNTEIAEKLMDYFFEEKWFIVFAMALGIVLGPLSVLDSFIKLRFFIDEVHDLLGI